VVVHHDAAALGEAGEGRGEVAGGRGEAVEEEDGGGIVGGAVGQGEDLMAKDAVQRAALAEGGQLANPAAYVQRLNRVLVRLTHKGES